MISFPITSNGWRGLSLPSFIRPVLDTSKDVEYSIH
jgi:hypothetical protein